MEYSLNGLGGLDRAVAENHSIRAFRRTEDIVCVRVEPMDGGMMAAYGQGATLLEALINADKNYPPRHILGTTPPHFNLPDQWLQIGGKILAYKGKDGLVRVQGYNQEGLIVAEDSAATKSDRFSDVYSLFCVTIEDLIY